MEPKTKKIVTTIAIIVGLVGAGTGIYFLVKRIRDKKLEGEIDTLLTIARNEGKMKEPDYQKYRKLMYVNDYNLPAELQAAFNRIKPMLQKAGDGIRGGFGVSAQQYFADIRNYIQTASPAVKNMYTTVQGLLAEAFKLNATDASVQQKINSSKQKSQSLWQSILYIHPIGAVYNVASGYTKAQWQDAKRFWDQHTINLLPENIEFNKKLLAHDFNTLKLFSEVYKVFSGGNDYFAVQKTPNSK